MNSFRARRVPGLSFAALVAVLKPYSTPSDPLSIDRLPRLEDTVQRLLQPVRLHRIRVLLPVIPPAIATDQLHIGDEIVHAIVMIVLELVLHRRQVCVSAPHKEV